MTAPGPANPLNTVRALRPSTDATDAAGCENRHMRAHHLQTDRARRTEAVIELLRRRAELRKAHGQAVPAALRKAIDDFDRHRHGNPPGLRAGRP